METTEAACKAAAGGTAAASTAAEAASTAEACTAAADGMAAAGGMEEDVLAAVGRLAAGKRSPSDRRTDTYSSSRWAHQARPRRSSGSPTRPCTRLTT